MEEGNAGDEYLSLQDTPDMIQSEEAPSEEHIHIPNGITDESTSLQQAHGPNGIVLGTDAMEEDKPQRIPSKPSRLDGTPHYRTKYIMSGHARSISAVKFSPDGNMLASCGEFGISTF